jgi:hypothetical protein
MGWQLDFSFGDKNIIDIEKYNNLPAESITEVAVSCST